MRHRILILLVLIPTLSAPVHAGIIFGRKKEKPDPKQRVPELVLILKSDKDSDKRSRAAEELRFYDPGQYPEIIPALIEALQNDQKPGVRIDALQSLTRMRPVSQPVGEALEAAVSKDASRRVRMQARSALLQYHWAGYRSGKKPEVPPVNNTSREPPLADKDKYPPAVNTTPAPAPLPASSYNPRTVTPMTPPLPPKFTTREPPLAPPLLPPEQLNPPTPVPAPPAAPIPMPTPPPTPMGSTPSAAGPDLGPDLR